MKRKALIPGGKKRWKRLQLQPKTLWSHLPPELWCTIWQFLSCNCLFRINTLLLPSLQWPQEELRWLLRTVYLKRRLQRLRQLAAYETVAAVWSDACLSLFLRRCCYICEDTGGQWYAPFKLFLHKHCLRKAIFQPVTTKDHYFISEDRKSTRLNSSHT